MFLNHVKKQIQICHFKGVVEVLISPCICYFFKYPIALGTGYVMFLDLEFPLIKKKKKSGLLPVK